MAAKLKLGKRGARKYKKVPTYKALRLKIPAVPKLDQKHPYGNGNLCSYDMNGNSERGDCVVAGSLNTAKLDNQTAGRAVKWNDNSWEKAYSEACGWDPNNPDATDNGCEITPFLDYVVKNGLEDADGNIHKISNHVVVDQTDINEVMEVVYFFDKCKIGIQFCKAAQDQIQAGQPWTVVARDGGILGGHDVEIILIWMDTNGKIWLRVATWGTTQDMDLDFFNKYCDEAHTHISPEMLTAKGISIGGWDWATLEQYLGEIGDIPTPEPVNTGKPTYITLSPATGVIGDKVKITGQLIETDNNNPIPKESLTFTVDGESIGNATTTARGNFSLNYKITEKTGTYQILANFAGDGNFIKSVGNNTLTVIDIPVPPVSCDSIIKAIKELEAKIQAIINLLSRATGNERKRAKEQLEKLLKEMEDLQNQ